MYMFKLIHLTSLGKTIYSLDKQLIMDLLASKPSSYKDKQLELLLYTMDDEDETIKRVFKNRKDYRFVDSFHSIHNQITNEESYCMIEKYVITFKSDTKNNIFYEVFYQNQENYVILDE